jgi:hypothetical protein
MAQRHCTGKKRKTFQPFSSLDGSEGLGRLDANVESPVYEGKSKNLKELNCRMVGQRQPEWQESSVCSQGESLGRGL